MLAFEHANNEQYLYSGIQCVTPATGTEASIMGAWRIGKCFMEEQSADIPGAGLPPLQRQSLSLVRAG